MALLNKFALITVFLCIFVFVEITTAETQKVGQPLFCHGCVAVIKELHQGLKDSSGRKKIIVQKLDNLCQVPNFVSYAFSPPKMIKACNYIVDTYRKELTNSLVEYYKKYKTTDNLKLQANFCDQVIAACKGMRRPETEDDMTPRGLSMDDANKKLQSMTVDDTTGSSLEIEEKATLEKPPEPVTISPREEL